MIWTGVCWIYNGCSTGEYMAASRQRTKQMRALKGWDMGCHLCLLLGSMQIHHPIYLQSHGIPLCLGMQLSVLNISGCIYEDQNVLWCAYTYVHAFVLIVHTLYLAKTVILSDVCCSGVAAALQQPHSSLITSKHSPAANIRTALVA